MLRIEKTSQQCDLINLNFSFVQHNRYTCQRQCRCLCIIRLSPTLFHSHLDAILVAASAGAELRFATLQTIITELAPSMKLPGDHFLFCFTIFRQKVVQAQLESETCKFQIYDSQCFTFKRTLVRRRTNLNKSMANQLLNTDNFCPCCTH